MGLFTSAYFDNEQLERVNFLFKKEKPLGILDFLTCRQKNLKKKIQ